jgi:hypothetical protein
MNKRTRKITKRKRNTQMYLPERPINILEEFQKLTPERTSTKKEEETPWEPPPPKPKIKPTQNDPSISKILKSIELVTLLEHHGIDPKKSNEIEQKLITNFIKQYGTNKIERKVRRTLSRKTTFNHAPKPLPRNPIPPVRKQSVDLPDFLPPPPPQLQAHNLSEEKGLTVSGWSIRSEPEKNDNSLKERLENLRKFIEDSDSETDSESEAW